VRYYRLITTIFARPRAAVAAARVPTTGLAASLVARSSAACFITATGGTNRTPYQYPWVDFRKERLRLAVDERNFGEGFFWREHQVMKELGILTRHLHQAF
jgi:hypothetical protein